MQALYPCVAAFGLALYLVLQTGLGAALNLAMLALMLIVSLVAAVLSKRERSRNAFLVVFFVLLGMLNGLRVGASAAEQLQPYFGKEVVLCGHIEALQSKERQEYVSCIMQCDKLQYGQQVMAYKGRVRLALPQQRSGHIVVRGRLEPLHSLRNPGGFDGALYNRINNIGGRLTKAQLVPTAEQGQAAPASSLWPSIVFSFADGAWRCVEPSFAGFNVNSKPCGSRLEQARAVAQYVFGSFLPAFRNAQWPARGCERGRAAAALLWQGGSTCRPHRSFANQGTAGLC